MVYLGLSRFKDISSTGTTVPDSLAGTPTRQWVVNSPARRKGKQPECDSPSTNVITHRRRTLPSSTDLAVDHPRQLRMGSRGIVRTAMIDLRPDSRASSSHSFDDDDDARGHDSRSYGPALKYLKSLPRGRCQLAVHEPRPGYMCMSGSPQDSSQFPTSVG